MKTVSVKPADSKRQTFLVDASGQTLGRLATEIARVLRGKHKPNFAPHIDNGDSVVVVNAEKIRLTGNKLKDKIYFHHTKWIGGIKSIPAQDLLKTHPERILTFAVKGMLPKSKLGSKIAKSLHVYAGPDHMQQAQNPGTMPARLNK